ncbi:MAG: peptide deformylase [Chitinophagaceae bacterium]
MILSIVAYGSPILRKVASPISHITPEITNLIQDMWDTLYKSNGVGLAAPQVNKSIQLFIVDSEQIFKNNHKTDYIDTPGIKQVFINPIIHKLEGKKWSYNEGCLSIPKITADVDREDSLTMFFYDENFKQHQHVFNGMTARIILHEYDHLQGKLFIDYISPLKKKLIKNKLYKISNGKIQTEYPMIFLK